MSSLDWPWIVRDADDLSRLPLEPEFAATARLKELAAGTPNWRTAWAIWWGSRSECVLRALRGDVYFPPVTSLTRTMCGFASVLVVRSVDSHGSGLPNPVIS